VSRPVRALLWMVVALATTSTTAGAGGPPVEFLEPRDGATVEGRPTVRVAGRADPTRPAPAAFDVVIVIDVSGSTSAPAALAAQAGPTGIRILGPRHPSGPSILDAEVTAALRLLDVADRRSTRVGVVTFSQSLGGLAGAERANAWVEQSLTADYDAVRAALERVRARAPQGGTDMVAGVRLALRELHGLDGSAGRPRQARKVMLLMTDGFPTLPFGNGRGPDERNVGVTVDAARVAARTGVTLHTFCLGPEALSAPVVCREAARVTGGTYHPVQRPADIVDILPATPIGRVDLVSVRNATTGAMAKTLSVQADGTFSADVPLAAGPNRLVVELHGADADGTATVVVHYRPAVDIEVQRDRARDGRVEVERRDTRDVEIKIERPGPGR
jgi:Mg-chelatase subunit ChlD